MENSIMIREYRDDDKHKILQLLNRNFQNQQHLSLSRDLEWWSWKYERSVFGKPIIYVTEVNGAIIGVRPLLPWKLNIRGTEFNCYQSLDSAVDREYRGNGLLAKMTRRVLLDHKDEINLVFTFPNEQSIRSFIRLGWTFLGKLRWNVKVNQPLKAYSFFKHYTGLSSYKLKPEDVISMEKMPRLDDHPNFDGKLKTHRSKEFLIWRYLSHPKICYGMNVIEKGKRQLCFIYEVNENEYGRELIIVDAFGDFSLADKMLYEVSLVAEKYNITCTLMLKNDAFSTLLLFSNKYLSYRKKNMVVFPLKMELETIATSYDRWDLFLGLHDSV